MSSRAVKKVNNMIGGYSEEHLIKVAKEAVEKKTKNSVILDRVAEERIPKFLMSEVTIDKVLGRGGFCVVQEITKIQLLATAAAETIDATAGAASVSSSRHGGDYSESNNTYTSHHHHSNNNNNNNNNGAEDDSHHHDSHHHDEHDFANLIQDRKFMAKHYIRRGKDYRYALKIVQESTKKDPQTFINGIVDLAIEARFLSVIRHSNIIKMRAMMMTTRSSSSSNSNSAFFDAHFFVILDKLYDILTIRLQKWKKRVLPRSKMARALLDRGGKKELAFWLERLTVGYDLSCALKYLHDLHILYRDIKPDNIGFDVRGDVKIFDFGLAKEVHPGKDQETDGSYHLTGDTGSPRYMAPEVALSKPYNETCDVYSFCILLWQMLKVEVPFDGFTMKMLTKKVMQDGVRPKPDDKAWPSELCTLLRQGWHADFTKRPSMETVSDTIRDVINRYSDEEINEILDASRKSELSLRRGSGSSNLSSLPSAVVQSDIDTKKTSIPAAAAKTTTTVPTSHVKNDDDSSSDHVDV